MTQLKQWFKTYKLSLHLNKTKIMLFGNCKKKNIHVQVMIVNVNTERVYENKFLGVMSDHKICQNLTQNMCQQSVQGALQFWEKLVDKACIQNE